MPNDPRRRGSGRQNAAGARRLQTPKLPPASRSSTTGLPLSVPRTSTKIATAPLPETASVPVFVVSRSVPLVTLTCRPNGTGPPANGLPFNSTVPVGVPLTAPGGATAIDGPRQELPAARCVHDQEHLISARARERVSRETRRRARSPAGCCRRPTRSASWLLRRRSRGRSGRRPRAGPRLRPASA